MALITLCALVVFFSAGCHSGEAAVAILGDSVTLTASESCTDGVLKTDNSRVTVAKFVNGAWKSEGRYKGRITHNSSTSVVLNKVEYNDKLTYEFYCKATVIVPIIQLEVIIPHDEFVTEGEQAQLKCYSQTAGRPVKFIRWEKDGELVFEQERATGLIRNGTGFRERNVSVSPDWYLTGDLSLTMKKVRMEDLGVYMCCTVEEDGGKRWGNPDAVRMEFTHRILDQNTTQTESPTQNVTDETQMRTRTAVGITAAVVGIITATVCFMVGWCMKTRSSKETPGPGVARCSDVVLELLNADGGTHEPPEADEGPSLEGSHAESNV